MSTLLPECTDSVLFPPVPHVVALPAHHTLVTLFSLPFGPCPAQMRMFEPKSVPKVKLLPLAAAYVGYIVLCNLNLNINPVGFYQITKIAGALQAGRSRELQVHALAEGIQAGARGTLLPFGARRGWLVLAGVGAALRWAVH